MSYTCLFLDVRIVFAIRSYITTVEEMLCEVKELTCCHGDEYQPRTTALEAVLLGTAWISSGHGFRLHPCCRSTSGLAMLLHLRMGKSTYLHSKSHVFDSTRVRRLTSPCTRCAAEGAYPPFWSLSPQWSSRLWKPDPQVVEHWNRAQAGGTILENELGVYVWMCSVAASSLLMAARFHRKQISIGPASYYICVYVFLAIQG